MPPTTSTSSPSLAGSAPKRVANRRIGLRYPLVFMLMTASAVVVARAFLHERSMDEFYAKQVPQGVDFDAPIEHSMPKRSARKSQRPSLDSINDNPVGKRLSLSPKKSHQSIIGMSASTNQSSSAARTASNSTSRLAMSPETIRNETKMKSILQHVSSEQKINNQSTLVQNKAAGVKGSGKTKPRVDAGDADEEDNGNEFEQGEENEREDEDEDPGAKAEEEEKEDEPLDVEGAGDALSIMMDDPAFVDRPWLRLNRTTAYYGNRTVVPFKKQPGVVIVTKIHGTHQLSLLKQSFCLLHYAYNRRPLYDMVVFSTMPVPEELMTEVQALVHPAKLTFVVDNRGLQEEIAALSKPRYDNFLKACGVDSPQNLTWWSQCPGRIAYNWQAEFRAWHIWKHPALVNYTHMMWIDTDAFCSDEWKVDPIVAMLENDLVILFDNWPKGAHGGSDVQKRIYDAFGHYVCKLKLIDGHFKSKFNYTAPCNKARINDVHGFFHITKLDFYRSAPVQKWAETWIGDGFLQRRYDDQSAVTIPAAVLAPDRAWDMRRNRIRLDVYHNSDLDGKKSNPVGGFKKYWKKKAKHQLPDAVGACPVTASN